jgi:hypothetical protein
MSNVQKHDDRYVDFGFILKEVKKYWYLFAI